VFNKDNYCPNLYKPSVRRLVYMCHGVDSLLSAAKINKYAMERFSEFE